MGHFERYQTLRQDLRRTVRKKITVEDFEVKCIEVVLEDLIPDEDCWIKNTFSAYLDGKVCFCLSGALKFIEDNHTLIREHNDIYGPNAGILSWRFDKLLIRIQNLVGPEYCKLISIFNDAQGTTYQDVVKLLQGLLIILKKEAKESRIARIERNVLADFNNQKEGQ